jgi:hypothetical protein
MSLSPVVPWPSQDSRVVGRLYLELPATPEPVELVELSI